MPNSHTNSNSSFVPQRPPVQHRLLFNHPPPRKNTQTEMSLLPMPALLMPSLPMSSSSSSVLPLPLQRTTIRIWRGLKCLVTKLARHDLAEMMLTGVRHHLLFENGVEITKELALPTLPKFWKYKVSRARDLSLGPEDMEPTDLEEL